ncbi:hypothetical protein ABN028_19550 [Actinopolymorpha sp. B17G11]|uniref:hypothetical protein n=1 Tax=Actinopolymorpha sp. B17G11 TaxID=3160861 RepID=UPI0032E36B49
MKTKNARARQHRRYMRHLAKLFPPVYHEPHPTGCDLCDATGGDPPRTHRAMGITVSAATLPPRATFRTDRRTA